MNLSKEIKKIRVLTEQDQEFKKSPFKVILTNEEIQSPTWAGLKKYWPYASPDEVEYIATSFTSHYAIICMTVASGQGGILAVWDVNGRRWAQISENSYIYCALMDSNNKWLISLHYISNYVTPGRHSVWITPFVGVKDSFNDISILIQAHSSQSSFDPKGHEISNFALAPYIENEYGPLGIFYSNKTQTFFLHDAGTLFTIQKADIDKVFGK